MGIDIAATSKTRWEEIVVIVIVPIQVTAASVQAVAFDVPVVLTMMKKGYRWKQAVPVVTVLA